MYIAKHYYPHIMSIIPVVILVIGIALIVFFKKPVPGKSKELLIFGIIFIIAGSVSSVAMITNYVDLYKNVFLTYKNGSYMECTGIVQNLNLISFDGNGNDEFDIDNIHFVVGNTFCPGYQKIASHGGIIDKNGLNVEIVYCEYQNVNYIMELRIVK